MLIFSILDWLMRELSTNKVQKYSIQIYIYIYIYMCVCVCVCVCVGRVAQWVYELTTGWTVRDRIQVGTRFSVRPNRSWGPPNLL